MLITYVVVSIALTAYLTFSAVADFVRYKQVLVVMASAGVPESWLPLLGSLKGAAAAGLLVGLVVPLLGIAAAIGVIAFFVGAFVVHVRARLYSFGSFVFPGTFLVLAVAVLCLELTNLDAWGHNCFLILRGCTG